MRVPILLCLCLVALPLDALAAQDFSPPAEDPSGTRIGLYGFGVRAGIDFTENGRLALGSSLDLGQIATSRLRLRAVGELSVFNAPNVYTGAFETVYHFTEPGASARPYAGLGLALAGGEGCSRDPGCPAVWFNVVLGFELRFRPTFNWLLEYHGMNLLRDNRIHIGLTTRQ